MNPNFSPTSQPSQNSDRNKIIVVYDAPTSVFVNAFIMYPLDEALLVDFYTVTNTENVLPKANTRLAIPYNVAEELATHLQNLLRTRTESKKNETEDGTQEVQPISPPTYPGLYPETESGS